MLKFLITNHKFTPPPHRKLPKKTQKTTQKTHKNRRNPPLFAIFRGKIGRIYRFLTPETTIITTTKIFKPQQYARRAL